MISKSMKVLASVLAVLVCNGPVRARDIPCGTDMNKGKTGLSPNILKCGTNNPGVNITGCYQTIYYCTDKHKNPIDSDQCQDIPEKVQLCYTNKDKPYCCDGNAEGDSPDTKIRFRQYPTVPAGATLHKVPSKS